MYYKFPNAKVSKRVKKKENSWLPSYVGIHGNELGDEATKVWGTVPKKFQN